MLAELLRLETAEPTAVVANSLGCQFALALGQRRPELVGPLVLIGPTVDPRYRSWLRHAWRIGVDTLREPVSLWPILLGDYARMGVPRVVATARAALDDRPETRLPALESPLLVLRGEHDGITTSDWGRRLASLAPRGRFEEVPRSAHAAHFSDPVPGLSARRVVPRGSRRSPRLARRAPRASGRAGRWRAPRAAHRGDRSRHCAASRNGTRRSCSPQSSSVGAVTDARSAPTSARATCLPPRTRLRGPARRASVVSRTRKPGRERATLRTSGQA